MSGKIHMPRFLFFMLMRQRRKPLTRQQKDRTARVEAAELSPNVAAFWSKNREIKHDRETARAGVAVSGFRPVSDDLGPSLPVQPEIDRAGVGGVQPAPDGTRRLPTLTGWYFYADGVLFQGFQTWEALQESLESASELTKTISEVNYHD